MGSRHSAHGGRGPGRQLDLPLRRTWPGEAGGPPAKGCIACSALEPGGAVLGWTRTWLAQPSEQGAPPLGCAGLPGSARGQCQNTRRNRCTFRPVRETGRRRTMGRVAGLQRRAHPTSATSSPPRCPAAPTAPHFQRRLSPRQRERAEVGTACERKVRPQGIFSSRGERCNPRLPPRPPQCTPLVYLGRRQGGGEEEEPGRARTRMPAPGEVSAGRFALTPEPSQDASGEGSTIPCLPLR